MNIKLNGWGIFTAFHVLFWVIVAVERVGEPKPTSPGEFEWYMPLIMAYMIGAPAVTGFIWGRTYDDKD